MKKSTSVWALIVNYNSAGECIELFQNLALIPNDQLQILIIDNASDETDQQKLRELIPSENLIFNKRNGGYAWGNNVGMRKALEAGADYIWILNPDMRVEENTLSGLLEAIKVHEKTAAAGLRLLKRENPEVIFTDGEKLNLKNGCKTYHINHNCYDKEIPGGIKYDQDYIDGSCILLNVTAIKDIGLLPEEYFLYFEETDWCLKARKKAWRLVINTGVKAYNLTSKKEKFFNYYYTRNKLIFCKKYDLQYNKVRKSEVKGILKEVFDRVKGMYVKPYFKYRLNGLISGIIKAEIHR